MRSRWMLAAAVLLAAGVGGTGLSEVAAASSTPVLAAPSAVKTATKTTAALQDGYVFGRVTAQGKGISGLKVRVQRKAGSTWTTYATVTTQKGGGYSAPLVRTGTYRAVTLASAKYKGSTSKPVSS
jgi:hypothetical protein